MAKNMKSIFEIVTGPFNIVSKIVTATIPCHDCHGHILGFLPRPVKKMSGPLFFFQNCHVRFPMSRACL